MKKLILIAAIALVGCQAARTDDDVFREVLCHCKTEQKDSVMNIVRGNIQALKIIKNRGITDTATYKAVWHNSNENLRALDSISAKWNRCLDSCKEAS